MKTISYKNLRSGIVLHGVHMTLGKYYEIGWGNRSRKVKLIKVTKYGYNLLLEKENRCILKKHLYVPIKERHKYEGNEKLLTLTSTMINVIRECE